MMAQHHSLLGRNWSQFSVRERKRKKRSEKNVVKPGMQEFTLFADTGNDIPRIPLSSLLDWALVLRQNADQLSGKLFERMTIPS